MRKETNMHQQRWMLVSPAGTPITGTLESLQGRANIVRGSARRDDAGVLDGVAPERLTTLPGGEKACASEWHGEEST
jgi:hypothetical protein